MALWPKRSKNTSPGSIVSTPMRGVASLEVGAGTAMPVSGIGSPGTAASARAANSARPATHHAANAGTGPRPRLAGAMDGEHEVVHAPAVGAADAEVQAAERELLAGFREVADRGGDEAADGVVLVVG